AQALQVWVYIALPELGATFGNPLPNNPSLPILAYKGRKGRKKFKEAILSQTRVINFVQKDIGQMFPKWEFDVEDTPAENIIKLMFVKKPWKWTMDYWEVTEASEEAAAEASEEDIADAMREGFGTCLKEIKCLSERVEVVEKKGHHLKTLPLHLNRFSNPGLNMCALFIVYGFYILKVLMGRTREGRAWRRIKVQMCPQLCPQLCPQMLVPRKIKLQNRALFYWTKINPLFRIYRRRMLDIRKRGMLLWHFAVQRVIEQGNLLPHSNLLIRQTSRPEKNLYPCYNPFAPIDKKKLKELSDWLKACPHYRTPLDKKPRKSRTWWFHILRTSLESLEDCHIDAWINVLRKRYDANPQHFRSERMCFLDHLFSQQWRFNFKDIKDSEPDQNGLGRRLPVNFADIHWIAMWISIPKRHIVVFDSICSSISPEELDVVMKPFLYMVPYLLIECASSDEQRAQYSLEPFTYERPTNIPPFSEKYFAKANGKTMRDKMAVDIFQELPDAHEFENKDNDDNLGAYDG
ncbi:unnamed protein product, partial [Brassica oleracea var. botrytis]